MLVAIIEDNDFSLEFVDSILTCNGAFLPNDNGNPRQLFCHEERFVTGFIGSHVDLFAVGNNTDLFLPVGPIAAVQNDDTVPHVANHKSHFLGGWGLSGTANRNIANADDAAVQLCRRQEMVIVAAQFEANPHFIKYG